MNTEQVNEKLGKQDISIQCELLIDGFHEPTQVFDIDDVKLRRRLMRRFYCLLMLEVFFAIPCLEILIHYQVPSSNAARMVAWVLLMLMYASLYIWRDWRRPPPYNYLVFLLITITSSISKSLFMLNIGRTRLVHAYPLILIAELLVLALYSKQYRLKFTVGIGIIIIYVLFALFLVLAYALNMFYELFAVIACTLEAWFILYDTSLMLSGRHGYNVGPKEYIFAACNIHADLPKLFWILCKFFVYSPFVAMIRFIQRCRIRQVC